MQFARGDRSVIWLPEASRVDSLGHPLTDERSETRLFGISNTVSSGTLRIPPISETEPLVSDKPEETVISDNTSASAVQPPAEDYRIMAYTLTESEYHDIEVLKSDLKLIRTSGFNTAVMTLKDENGYFYYNTDSPHAAAASDGNIRSELSAAEIADAFSECGLVPAARISILKDSAYYGADSGLSYESEGGGIWTDKYGKPWLSPYSRETAEYVSEITEELADAGFRYIICSDIEFPELEKSDYSQIGEALAFRDRYTVLVKTANILYDTAHEHGAEMIAEVSFDDLIDDTAEYFRPDELKCKRAAVICTDENAGDITPVDPAFGRMKAIPCCKVSDPDSALRSFASKGFSESIVY